MTENAQAVAILQRLAIKFPRDVEVLAAYGKTLADAGRPRQAAEVLAHAHTPERPDWSVLSAQGSVADQLGDHEQAQAYYAAALKIVPAQPHILSNLGLSYALSKKLPQAETALQQAAAQHDADRPVRQNLALVLALEGKFASAEEVARRDLDAKDAAANVAAIRRMIPQSNTGKRIQELDTKQQSAAKTHMGSNLEKSTMHEGQAHPISIDSGANPAIVASILSPLTTGPTPAGVPVKMRSPGAISTCCERKWMIWGTPQIMPSRSPLCRHCPFTLHSILTLAIAPVRFFNAMEEQGAEKSNALAI